MDKRMYAKSLGLFCFIRYNLHVGRHLFVLGLLCLVCVLIEQLSNSGKYSWTNLRIFSSLHFIEPIFKQ